MPVCLASEIGGDGTVDFLATTLKDQPGSVVQYQRGAVCHAEDNAAMAPAAVCNDDCECAGELARFAAELQISPTRLPRQLWNTHTLDDLVRDQPCLENSGREFC